MSGSLETRALQLLKESPQLVGLDETILQYVSSLLVDTSIDESEAVESVIPMLTDATSLEESDAHSLLTSVLKNLRKSESDASSDQPQILAKPVQLATPSTQTESKFATNSLSERGKKDDTPVLLSNPIVLAKKIQDEQDEIISTMKFLGFIKIPTLSYVPITPNTSNNWTSEQNLDSFTESSLLARKKNEKKQIREEKRGVRREKENAHQTQMMLQQLTRQAIVLRCANEGGGARDIKLDNISMDLGGMVLLEGASIIFSVGRRYGLVGRNGVGKTTFMKHMSGKAFPGIPPHLQILHIEQEVEATEISVIQTVLNTDVERESLLRYVKTIETKLAGSTENPIPKEEELDLTKKLADYYTRLQEIEADAAPARAAAILSGLGFTPEEQERPTKEFSGGWRMRVSLAMALFIQPDVLLLDEPTNHLDLHAVLWLEEYLEKWTKTLIVVSHDREFLNSVSTDIIHLHAKTLVRYKGNYDTFQQRRAEKLKNQEREHEAQEKHRQHVQQFIDRFRYNAKRASMVQSRIKALNKMDIVSEVADDPTIQFNFPEPEKLPPPLIQVIGVSFSYPGTNGFLFEDLNFSIDMDSRICLVGPNGIGKSTLLKVILGELQPSTGYVNINGKARFAKFNQHHADQLDMELSPLEFFKSKFKGDPAQKIRQHLGSMGLSGKLALQPIYSLSGGQKSRVSLAYITYTKPHVLILDEPTNHLDLDTVQALIQALSAYQGGCLVVSHDEHLITAVCDELWILNGKKITVSDGDFEQYKKSLQSKYKLSSA